jgi:hypothetical protein
MPNFHVTFRDLLHAVNLRHETDGFTAPPKEGVLRIFSPWKIRRLRPGSKGQHATSRPPKPLTHIQYNTSCFSTTMVARTRINVTLYVHCLSCYSYICTSPVLTSDIRPTVDHDPVSPNRHLPFIVSSTFAGTSRDGCHVHWHDTEYTLC